MLPPSRKEQGLESGALFPGLRVSEVLEQLLEVGFPPSSLQAYFGDHLKLEGVIEVGSGAGPV